MHAVIVNTVSLILLVASSIALAQGAVAPDNRYKISLTVDGVAIKGSQELEAQMVGKPKAEQEAVQAEAIPLVNRGQTLQLIVAVTDPAGVTKTYPKGKRISFQTFGCMKLGAGGAVIVTAKPNPASCSVPVSDYRPLAVVFNDANGNAVAYSEYIFKLRP